MQSMGLFGIKKQKEPNFEQWAKNASLEELKAVYECERQRWMKNGQDGTGEKSHKMKRLDAEISKRVAEEWEKDPRRNRDPYFHWTDANRWDKD